MNDFTGRRASGAAKRIGKGFLEGLSYVGTVLADGPKLQRIEEIDKLIVDLKQERDHLIHGLIEPGDLKVSDDYDPHWRRTTAVVSSGEGRLTTCRGSWDANDRFNECHPGCPYKGTKHNEHEFTLND